MTSIDPAHKPVRASRGRRAQPSDVHLRITLMRIDPPIWRLVRVPDDYTLHQLHRVVQFVFGWMDYHLYAFRVGQRRFEAAHPEANGEDASTATLRGLGLETGTVFTYTYDFGDDWEHEIVAEAVFPADRDPGDPALPDLSDGERAGPPEDCGGPHGYAEMNEALRNRRHPRYKEYLEWVGRGYDPDRFDLRMARNNLALAAVYGAI